MVPLSREVMSDLDVLERLAGPSGKDVVDIGCGGGALVRALTARGARVTGVEISEGQLAPALANDDGSGARYVIGRAQALPLEDGSVDVAVFMRTLHHVPPGDLLDALRETRRVLRPGGVVFVAEPLAEGEFFELTRVSRTSGRFAPRRRRRWAERRPPDSSARPRSSTTCGCAWPTWGRYATGW
jgi:ubiquinone/menaquinone biosynthesis C-methylase UbiE